MAKKLSEADVLDILSNVEAKGSNIVEAGLIQRMSVTDDAIELSLELDPAAPNLSAATAMSVRTALKVAGWQGEVKIESVRGAGGQAPGKSAGPQLPPPQAPKPRESTKVVPPKRGPGGLPVVGSGKKKATASGPAPPKRGPKGLPVVGSQGPQAGGGGGARQSPLAPSAQPQQGSQQGTPFQKKPVPGVKYIIAVASGKGGVGKSTVATNLAAALTSLDYDVGLLDNDVYGPSAPVMMGVHAEPEVANKKLIPIEQYGIKTMSLGYLLDEGAPVIWRGPIVLQVTDQLFYDVAWGELDFLICDLPPGTGDVQLTMAQKVPVTGAVIVTTPQDVALADVERGLKMFNKVEVPVLGVVENMASFACPHCEKETPIFGKGGGKRKAKQLKIPYLGEIPLDPSVREWGDKGKPIVLSQPDSAVAKRFIELARQVVAAVEDEGQESGLSKITKRVLKIIQ